MCCLLVSGMHLRVVGTKDNSENESIFVGFFFLFSSFLSTAPSLLHPFHNYTFSNSFSPQVEASPSFFFFFLSILLQGSSSIERQNSSNKKSSYLRLISLFFFFLSYAVHAASCVVMHSSSACHRSASSTVPFADSLTR